MNITYILVVKNMMKLVNCCLIVVLIRDDSLKRNMWRKGKVKKLVKGEDGKIRGALLKVCHGGRTTFIHGPLQRIVPLEVQKDIDDIDATFSETEDNAAIEIEMKMPAAEIVKDRCNVVIHNGDGRKLVDKSAQLSR